MRGADFAIPAPALDAGARTVCGVGGSGAQSFSALARRSAPIAAVLRNAKTARLL
jgi:hypothetical protein